MIEKKRILKLFIAVIFSLMIFSCAKSSQGGSKAKIDSSKNKAGNKYKAHSSAYNMKKSSKRRKKHKKNTFTNPAVKEGKRFNLKMGHELKKPRYSDPLYFGENKPPKKKKASKRKLKKRLKKKTKKK